MSSRQEPRECWKSKRYNDKSDLNQSIMFQDEASPCSFSTRSIFAKKMKDCLSWKYVTSLITMFISRFVFGCFFAADNDDEPWLERNYLRLCHERYVDVRQRELTHWSDRSTKIWRMQLIAWSTTDIILFDWNIKNENIASRWIFMRWQFSFKNGSI